MLLESLRNPTAQPGSQPAFVYPAQRQATGSALLQHSDKAQETLRWKWASITGSYPFPELYCVSVLLLALTGGTAPTTKLIIIIMIIQLKSIFSP